MDFPAEYEAGSSRKRLRFSDDEDDQEYREAENLEKYLDGDEEYNEEEYSDDEYSDEEDEYYLDYEDDYEYSDEEDQDYHGEDEDEDEDEDENEDEDEDEDEDHEDENNEDAIEEEGVEQHDRPNLFVSRTTTFPLVDAMAKFNDRQRKAVRELGFSTILDLKIKEVPLKLASWVVNSYDHRDSCLDLQKNRHIEVQEEDVYRIFGFPRGSQTIDRPRGSQTRSAPTCDLLEQWYNFFPDRRKIGANMLAKVMLKNKSGGLWFKRHFVILLIVSLIENTTDGRIHPKVLHYLQDPDNAKNLNWGAYTMESLMNRKSAFNTKKTVFSGPTLFLVLFYLDRVRYVTITVPRSYPVCANWTHEDIKAREMIEIKEGGFGYGFPLDPIKCDTTSEGPSAATPRIQHTVGNADDDADAGDNAGDDADDDDDGADVGDATAGQETRKNRKGKGKGKEKQIIAERRKTTRTQIYVVTQINANDALTTDEAAIAYLTFHHDQDSL